MKAIKTFLITFMSSVCVVFISFAALYWLITPSQQPAGTNQNNIPITGATGSDVGNALVFLQKDSDGIFLLLKLDAINSKVSATAISPDYYIPHCSRTVMQSFEYAGIMQCVQDLSQHLETDISWHLVLDKESLPLLAASFIAEADAAFSADAESIAALAADVIKINMSEIQSVLLPSIPKNFSWLHTNIGKTEAAHISRILTLLMQNSPKFTHSVLSSS